jgi:hypothetical protein
MIVENELTAAQYFDKVNCVSVFIYNFVFFQSSASSILLKTVVLFSTLVLLASIVWYHVIVVKVRISFHTWPCHESFWQLFMNDNGAKDWRIAMTNQRCTQIAVELAVCLVCPIPFKFDFVWTAVHSDGVMVGWKLRKF